MGQKVNTPDQTFSNLGPQYPWIDEFDQVQNCQSTTFEALNQSDVPSEEWGKKKRMALLLVIDDLGGGLLLQLVIIILQQQIVLEVIEKMKSASKDDLHKPLKPSSCSSF